MDKKLKGSWLIHHTNKLQNVTNQSSFNKTYIAGKAGVLLSAVSQSNASVIDNARLEVLASAANINPLELPSLVNLLKDNELIDKSNSGIAVLGITTSAALEHTCNIFDKSEPGPTEQAAILLAEDASNSPVSVGLISEKISDIYKIPTQQTKQLIIDSENIGFVDSEVIDQQTKLLFNGNLFRRDDAVKINKVLDSLKQEEQRCLKELTEILRKRGCITVEEAKKILNENLFNKVCSIGIFDINIVSNNTEEVGYLTLPSAFSKFSSSIIEDAFDLAKAFVASLTYGMTKSSYARGQITMIERLLQALIEGRSVGPVNAIGQDYKILELKGVVEIKHGSRNGRSGPMMRLLKKEVGELALQAITKGDVSEQSLEILPGAAITRYKGPEVNREISRKKQLERSAKETNDMIIALRTGGTF
ncbi:hypothetical protein [Rheinheimera fenheensis]|uniref:hypothetical protein n=1 Tax=Rheinheimera fenheensis TaxID=3152295 RepID=UPI0032611C7A